MYLVLRRGAIDRLDLAGALAGSAAVACLRTFALDPAHAAAIERWRSRPGKVCLRARSDAQWDAVRAEPHVAAGNPGSGEVIALPPRRRSQRGPALEKLQAMSSALEPPARRADVRDVRRAVTYVLNPAALMSSGKSIAQIAHAAVAAGRRSRRHMGGRRVPGPRRRTASAGVRRGRGARHRDSRRCGADRGAAGDDHRCCARAQPGPGAAGLPAMIEA
jgi:hypothetical protein